MHVAAYRSDIVENLPRVRIAHEQAVQQKSRLPLLGNTICQANLQEDVYISLLHKHFEAAPDQRIVRFREGSTIRVLAASAEPQVGTTLVPYTWKLQRNPDTGSWAWYPVEFVQVDSRDTDSVDLPSLARQMPSFLETLAQQLIEANLTEIYAISTIPRDHIPLGKDEILVERSLPDHTLVLTPVKLREYEKRDSAERATDVETFWKFSEEDGVITCAECGICTESGGHNH